MLRRLAVPTVLFSTALLAAGCSIGGGGGGKDTSGGAETDTGGSQAIVGTWRGQVTQYGSKGAQQSRYVTIMSINSVDRGATVGRVRYPSFPCGGQLQLSRIQGDRYVLDERITVNKKECTSGGRIEAKLRSRNVMSWRWYKGQQEVIGTLKRIT